MKFEYWIVDMETGGTGASVWVEELDHQGSLGWELVQVLEKNSRLYAIFKRPIKSRRKK